MIKKIKVFVLVMALLSLIHFNSASAATGSMSTAQTHSSTGSSGSPSSGGPDNGPPPKESYPYYSNDGRKFVCRYYNNIQRDRDIVANAYDMKGNSLIPDKFTSMNNYPLYSGTWIGININEKKKVSWNFTDFEYKEIKKEYKCSYTGSKETSSTVPGHYHNGVCVPGPTTYGYYPCDAQVSNYEPITTTDTITISADTTMNNSKCPHKSGYSPTKYEYIREIEEDSTDAVANANCKKNAIKRDLNSALGYLNYVSIEMKYNISNESSDKEWHETTILSQIKNIPENALEQASGTASSENIIGPKKVCMDVITSKVYYDDKCDNEKAIISNTTVYEPTIGKNLSCWHYFIPLDATTAAPYAIIIADKGGTPLSENECDYVIEHNSEYIRLIQPVKDNGELMNNGYTNNPKYDQEHFKKCIFAVTIDFGKNIIQKFYGETKNNQLLSLKGYGMYFRQIDINNPFPNLNENSYWYGYEKTKLKTFEAKTYIADLSKKENINTIKAYNKKYPYTKWTSDEENGIKTYGINKNGESNFIQKNPKIFKTSQKSGIDYYKLGCGPIKTGVGGC